MNNLSLGQRLMADTPAFFKKVHFIGLLLVGLAVTLAQYPVVPQKVALITGIAGATLAVISLFAVKDVADLAGSSVADALAKLIPDVLSQVNQVAGVLADHSATLSGIDGKLQVLAAAPQPSPAPVQVNVVDATQAPETIKDAGIASQAIVDADAIKKVVIPPPPAKEQINS